MLLCFGIVPIAASVSRAGAPPGPSGHRRWPAEGRPHPRGSCEGHSAPVCVRGRRRRRFCSRWSWCRSPAACVPVTGLVTLGPDGGTKSRRFLMLLRPTRANADIGPDIFRKKLRSLSPRLVFAGVAFGPDAAMRGHIAPLTFAKRAWERGQLHFLAAGGNSQCPRPVANRELEQRFPPAPRA